MIGFSAASIFFLILLAVFLGAILTLTGVALGALVVFRTKREPHESLFKPGGEKGDAFLLDDYETGVETRPEKERDSKADDPVPGIMARQTQEFLRQLQEGKKAKDER